MMGSDVVLLALEAQPLQLGDTTLSSSPEQKLLSPAENAAPETPRQKSRL